MKNEAITNKFESQILRVPGMPDGENIWGVSAVVGKICPPVGIGLIDLPNIEASVTPQSPAYPVPASLYTTKNQMVESICEVRGSTFFFPHVLLKMRI